MTTVPARTIPIQPAQTSTTARNPCDGCPENTPLFKPEDIFDELALQGYIARRRACPLRQDTDKPCLRAAPSDTTAQAPAPDTAQCALQAQDETESIRTALRACLAVADLIEAAPQQYAAACMAPLGALLEVHCDAIADSLDAIDALMAAARRGASEGPHGAAARLLVQRASGQAADLRQSHVEQAAFEGLRDPHSAAWRACIAAQLRAVCKATAALTAAMDDALDAIHAELTSHPSEGEKA